MKKTAENRPLKPASPEGSPDLAAALATLSDDQEAASAIIDAMKGTVICGQKAKTLRNLLKIVRPGIAPTHSREFTRVN